MVRLNDDDDDNDATIPKSSRVFDFSAAENDPSVELFGVHLKQQCSAVAALGHEARIN